MDKFKEENGSYICRDLLGYNISLREDLERVRELGLFTTFCPKMVESAAEILEEILDAENERIMNNSIWQNNQKM